ncbi:MAG TPA: 4Fe-4S binding protein [Oscillospiraceae bacterium]|nr:4Fe-4S binding protein [Oscillospiraceae bacterium]HNW05325.1 4Fe-4S binding protein [Oscillospiraceae bacterium]HPW00109.1 4Fe-4S binding protein [Oscillospiraceae bacterium]
MPFESGRGEDAAEHPGKKLTVNVDRCPQSHSCPSVKVCPAGALAQEGFHAPTVDQEKCIRCGKCVKTCRKKVLILEK